MDDVLTMSEAASDPYCRPLNAGLASEPKAVARRLARLVRAVDDEVNSMVVSGRVLDDLREFRKALCKGLAEDGWDWTFGGSDRLKFRPPGVTKGRAT